MTDDRDHTTAPPSPSSDVDGVGRADDAPAAEAAGREATAPVELAAPTPPSHEGANRATRDKPSDPPEARPDEARFAPRRDRAERSPSLGGALVAAIAAIALAPIGALVVVATHAPETAKPEVAKADPPPVLDVSAVAAALDAIDVEARRASETADALERRAVDAERGDRLRVVQKRIVLARDARRAAGQTGPALRGPFPIGELGDVSALGLSRARWLMSRDGVVVAPADVAAPVALAPAGREEEPAQVDATFDDVAVVLVRRCVPFEPYCLVDVEPKAASVRAPAVATAEARAALATIKPPTTTAAVTAPPSTPSPSGAPLVPLGVIAAVALGAGVFVARRAHALSGAVRQATSRLRAGASGRAATAPRHGLAELDALEAAIDEAHATMTSARDDSTSARQRERLTAIADALSRATSPAPESSTGRAPLGADDGDDVVTARLALAADGLIEALRAHALRTTLVLDEVEPAVSVLGPLAQRLLRLGRVAELPPAVADELASLGTAIGQKARAQHALASHKAELAPHAPQRRDVMVDAEALKALSDADAERLGAWRPLP